jgi:hypothetical protein
VPRFRAVQQQWRCCRVDSILARVRGPSNSLLLVQTQPICTITVCVRQANVDEQTQTGDDRQILVEEFLIIRLKRKRAGRSHGCATQTSTSFATIVAM